MRNCPVCGGEVRGRKDKVYCSPTCKSSAQYEKRLSEEDFFFQVDRHLKLNRKLLKKYNQAGKSTIRKERLLAEGFNPKYFTHFWKNQNGQVYLFCYEYGFLSLTENNRAKYLLVEWQEYMH